MGRRKKNRSKVEHHSSHHSPTEEDGGDVDDPLTIIKSSWFGDEIKWISRHDDNDGNRLTSSKSSSSTAAAGENNHLKQDDQEDTYQSLTSTLIQLKHELMPAAKSCADAINNSKSSNATTTTTSPQYEFRQARSTCNPYEQMGDAFIRSHYHHRNDKNTRKRRRQRQPSSVQFVNRSAIKLANIDSLLGFILTKQHIPSTSTVAEDDSTDDNYFAFVDLCGAPGGFSEFLLHRHMHPPPSRHGSCDQKSTAAAATDDVSSDSVRLPCYGFGMSLSGRNDEGKGVKWDLNHLKKHYDLQQSNNDNNNLADNTSYYATNQSSKDDKNLLHYHVCTGSDGTGSIYHWENIMELQRQISLHLPQNKQRQQIHLVVADGGFDSQRDANNQEVLAHHIVVSQTAAALTLLRKGGIFVVKMFGFHEESTKRILRYLYHCFDKMTFVKPLSSRPASAERYLVCCGYDGSDTDWDGVAWKQQQMEVSTSLECEGNKSAPSLDYAANAFDLDMLKLNAESCRSIIDYLHQRRDSVAASL